MTFAATLCTRKVADTIHNSDYPAYAWPNFYGQPTGLCGCVCID
ncbi:hypothetical protein [Psychrobacter sp. JCM 18900]